MKYVICFLLSIALFSGCGKKSEQNGTQTNLNKQDVKSAGESNTNNLTDSLKFEIKNFKKTYKNCSEDSMSCTYLKVSYPFFEEKNSVKDINSTLFAYITDSIFTVEGKGSNKSLEGLANVFFSEYENFKKEVPEYEPGYALDISGNVLFNKPNALSVCIGFYINTGGAHPNSYMKYFVFNPKTGKQLKPGDIFVSSFETKLNKLIDKKYRENNKLKDSDRLDSEKGMLFENYIKYNDNFILTKEGVEFLYNRYEIAAYVYGETEIKFSYKELQEILKPEFK